MDNDWHLFIGIYYIVKGYYHGAIMLYTDIVKAFYIIPIFYLLYLIN